MDGYTVSQRSPAPMLPNSADPFAALNAQQRSAVEHGIAEAPPRPLLVIAGAGTGKTMTLASRVARLVLAGADPQRILLLTFSRRAALEMQRRVGRVLHQAMGLRSTQPSPELPWAGTFHSVGARLLREYAGRIGLSDSFTIHDRSDAEDLMGLVREELGFARSTRRFPLKGTCLAIYSRAVNSEQALADVLAQTFPWCAGWEEELTRLFRGYVQDKQRQRALDYDDLLLYWAQMVAEPALAREVGARFDHVLVDEYQDTNRLQASILLAMKPDGRGLTVVGDDAQSVYSFRAAEVRNILDFARSFEPPATVLALERNYRSTQPILDASNAVIALAGERYAKNLWSERRSSERPLLVGVADEAEQAGWVADQVLDKREGGLQLKSQAVLFRASHHSAALELELARRDIPFVKFGGLKFLEAAHVKDVLAVLRWVHNPRSRMAGFRVAQLVPGIGPANARRVLDAMDEAADPVSALRAFEAPAGTAGDWTQWLATFDTLRRGAWPDEVDIACRWYQPHLERLHEDAAVRRADLAQLSRIATTYPSRERFLTELTLDPPDATSDESGPPGRDEDYLILSTMHSAKGQEWAAVYVLNVVDGCIPSDMATGTSAQIDEERRLLYVAMTRAKQHLQLIAPQRFYVHQQAAWGDRNVYGSLSRFIPEEIQGCFDRGEPAARAATTRPDVGAAAAIDLQARVRARF